MNKLSKIDEPKVVNLKLTTWAFIFAVIGGIILSILMLYSDFFSAKNEWLLKLCITQFVFLIVYSVYFDSRSDINKKYEFYEKKITLKEKQIENEGIAKANKLYSDTVEKCKKLEIESSLALEKAKNTQIDIDREWKKILTWKKTVGILQYRIDSFRKAYKEDTERRIKNMTEKEKLNNGKKYLKYRKKRYYEIDSSELPKMEEHEMLMFLVETLQDELLKLKNR